MAYNDEALKAKLSTLNETQDSIVSVSQWITFHKRHADRIASFWLTRLREAPPPKRLNFIYLVNDIVQNARARKRAEFPEAFSPLMSEAIATAYRSSTQEVQGKIRRVVEVWRNRAVFDTEIQKLIETKLDEIDASKGKTGISGGGKLMGKSLFSSSSDTGMPKELESLAPLQIAVTKATIAARPNIDTAQNEYTKLNDPDAELPTPPVHAARLSSLMKSLANAESGVSASIKARQELVKELERILEINKVALAKDDETYLDLSSRRTSTEAKKKEVEDNILRGLSSGAGPGDGTITTDFDIAHASEEEAGHHRNGSMSATPYEAERPDFEELTPEPDSFSSQHAIPNNPNLQNILGGFTSGSVEANIGLAPSKVRQASDSSLNGMVAKRRKMSHGDDQALVPDFGEMGMDLADITGSAALPDDSDAPAFNTTSDVGDDILRNLDEDVNDLIRQQGI